MRIAALLSVLCAWGFSAAADIVKDVLGCAEDPCVIHYSPGGKVREFDWAAEAINSGARTRVIVAGACISACTRLLDKVGEKACLKPRARLEFHRATLPHDVTLFNVFRFTARKDLIDVEYSPPIEEWKRSIGGLPEDGSLREMPIHVAQGIWSMCDPTPLPRPRPKHLQKGAVRAAFLAHALY